MRAREFITAKDQLDEVLPLIGLAARAVGGAIGKAAVKGAVKGAGSLAKGTVNAATKPFQSQTNTPAAAQTAAVKNPTQARAQDRAKDQLIKPGTTVQLPTAGTGGLSDFKITQTRGDDVEIENPKPGPNEPKKLVYKKSDIKQSMSL
jgi:hypothetical protein